MQIGAGIELQPLLSDADYQGAVLQNFSTVMPTNAFKFTTVRPTQNTWNFKAADYIYQWAIANDLTIRANCLVWHANVPAWLLKLSPSKLEAWGIFSTYIRGTMRRYPAVCSWDICNEAVGDDAKPRNLLRCLLGDDYVAQSFILAHCVSPGAKLFYCDYGLRNRAKWDAIALMVKSLVSRKIPIDGVAFQLHSNLLPLPDYKAIAYRTKQFQDMGLEVQFSEIVVWNRQGIGSQAGIYRRFVQVGVDCGVELFGFWSPFDKYPWFAPTKFTPAGIGSPGLFDANFKIKSTGRAAFKTLI